MGNALVNKKGRLSVNSIEINNVIDAEIKKNDSLNSFDKDDKPQISINFSFAKPLDRELSGSMPILIEDFDNNRDRFGSNFVNNTNTKSVDNGNDKSQSIATKVEIENGLDESLNSKGDNEFENINGRNKYLKLETDFTTDLENNNEDVKYYEINEKQLLLDKNKMLMVSKKSSNLDELSPIKIADMSITNNNLNSHIERKSNGQCLPCNYFSLSKRFPLSRSERNEERNDKAISEALNLLIKRIEENPLSLSSEEYYLIRELVTKVKIANASEIFFNNNTSNNYCSNAASINFGIPKSSSGFDSPNTFTGLAVLDNSMISSLFRVNVEPLLSQKQEDFLETSLGNDLKKLSFSDTSEFFYPNVDDTDNIFNHVNSNNNNGDEHILSRYSSNSNFVVSTSLSPPAAALCKTNSFFSSSQQIKKRPCPAETVNNCEFNSTSRDAQEKLNDNNKNNLIPCQCTTNYSNSNIPSLRNNHQIFLNYCFYKDISTTSDVPGTDSNRIYNPQFDGNRANNSDKISGKEKLAAVNIVENGVTKENVYDKESNIPNKRDEIVNKEIDKKDEFNNKEIDNVLPDETDVETFLMNGAIKMMQSDFFVISIWKEICKDEVIGDKSNTYKHINFKTKLSKIIELDFPDLIYLIFEGKDKSLAISFILELIDCGMMLFEQTVINKRYLCFLLKNSAKCAEIGINKNHLKKLFNCTLKAIKEFFNDLKMQNKMKEKNKLREKSTVPENLNEAVEIFPSSISSLLRVNYSSNLNQNFIRIFSFIRAIILQSYLSEQGKECANKYKMEIQENAVEFWRKFKDLEQKMIKQDESFVKLFFRLAKDASAFKGFFSKFYSLYMIIKVFFDKYFSNVKGKNDDELKLIAYKHLGDEGLSAKLKPLKEVLFQAIKLALSNENERKDSLNKEGDDKMGENGRKEGSIPGVGETESEAESVTNITTSSLLVNSLPSFSLCPHLTRKVSFTMEKAFDELIELLEEAKSEMKEMKSAKNAPASAPFALIITDIEGSTRLYEQQRAAMSKAVQAHHRTIRNLIKEHNGYEVKVIGDSFVIAFCNLVDAVATALRIQVQLLRYHDEKFQMYEDCECKPVGSKETVIVVKGSGEERENDNNGGSAGTGWVRSEFAEAEALTLPQEQAVWNKHSLRVRIGVHWCTNAKVTFDTVEKRNNYSGYDVTFTDKIENLACGGQVLIDENSLEVLLKSPEFHQPSPLLRDLLSIAPQRGQSIFKNHLKHLEFGSSRSILSIENAKNSSNDSMKAGLVTNSPGNNNNNHSTGFSLGQKNSYVTVKGGRVNSTCVEKSSLEHTPVLLPRFEWSNSRSDLECSSPSSETSRQAISQPSSPYRNNKGEGVVGGGINTNLDDGTKPNGTKLLTVDLLTSNAHNRSDSLLFMTLSENNLSSPFTKSFESEPSLSEVFGYRLYKSIQTKPKEEENRTRKIYSIFPKILSAREYGERKKRFSQKLSISSIDVPEEETTVEERMQGIGI